ncbi:SusC/RagA family TonB-linked outer membrane protein [Flavobacterium subsaxonicum]|uniref:TonB-dependent receptor n=1 Tax=Flavobacterium subsaxonicum WB 4.1-42 = DSM 21790 TaxID=1121898 RepID=A0A0A2MQ39_9FLAO|nr:SusC/RagA family TonB-linked outer membrane protein [Flavobacterium subsaxonicum]KGO93651.1 TonB-dependent receptor [Flavobacterium subsaxonicum WB 4.1-42 = DSM 21790]
MNYFLFCKGRVGLWYTLVLAVYLCSCSAIASEAPPLFLQQQKITGVITDALGPLQGVNIIVKGTTVRSTSDELGRYNINAATGDILVFSFMGFKTIEIGIGQQTIVSVLLIEDTMQLEEVVVNAGYYSVKQKESTGSIARITSKDIEKQPVTNFLATMQGRMAGVAVTQSTGIAGGSFDIKIRGINSLRSDGNNPLYIIDGVPYTADAIGQGFTNTVMQSPTSPLNNINPADIESLEVLKDADATAIYGSRGANGVVLITTKKGKAGKTKFTVSFAHGLASVTRFMDMMNTQQYLKMRRQAFVNDGITEYPAYEYDINGTWEQNRNTNWQKVLFGGTAEVTSLQSSLSGGNQQTQFSLSGNFGKETTVFPGDFRYLKGNVRAGLNHESLDQKFKVGFSAGYTIQDNNQPSTDITTQALSLAPNAPNLYDATGNLNWENNTFENPLRLLSGKSFSKTYDLVSSANFSYEIANRLILKTSLGYTDLNHTESSSQPSTIFNPAYELGPESSQIFVGTTSRKSWIVEPQLNYGFDTGKLQVEALVGSTFQSQRNEQLGLQASGFTSNSLIYNLAAASNIYVINNDISQYRYQAFYGRLNLNWDKRYIINITGRRDGSSRFGPGRQFAWFGAVGGAWLFSNENFLKENSFLSFGKIRASYGTTGSDQIGNYQFLDTYTTAGTNYQGVIGLQPTRLFNPLFGWERSKKLEVALEAGFCKDRIFVTAAWYKNRSSNQLAGIPLPGTTGFQTLQANMDATVENRGVEVTLRTINITSDHFNWTTSINFSKSKNELVSFPGIETSTYANLLAVGAPLNIKKVYHYTGIDSQAGTYTFQDVNNDGLYNAADRKTIVDLNPKFYGGIQNQLKYGNVELDFLFQFVKQRNYNTAAFGPLPGTMRNVASPNVSSWTSPENTGAYQLYTSGANSAAAIAYGRYIASDAVITDASYVRLKNIGLSWDIPQKYIPKIHCKIYFQGQNLIIFTKFKGADPEFSATGALPPLKVLTTGIQLTF